MLKLWFIWIANYVIWSFVLSEQEADDIQRKLRKTQTTLIIKRFLQIHSLKPNSFCIVSSKHQEALSSTWKQINRSRRRKTLYLNVKLCINIDCVYHPACAERFVNSYREIHAVSATWWWWWCWWWWWSKFLCSDLNRKLVWIYRSHKCPFGWSPLILLFPSPPVSSPILWWLYQEHHLELV